VPADQDERVGVQSLEEDLTFGPEEARVTTLANHVVVRASGEVGRDVGSRVAFEGR